MYHDSFFYLFLVCTVVGIPCYCEIQGSDACSSLPNSQCNTQSGACECAPSYVYVNGLCTTAITNDGSAISPFTNYVDNPVDWYVATGSDNTAYGLQSNGKFLTASGSVSMECILVQALELSDVQNKYVTYIK